MRDCNNDGPTTVPLLQKFRGTVLSCQHAWQAHVNWPIVQLGFIEKKPEIEIRACTQAHSALEFKFLRAVWPTERRTKKIKIIYRDAPSQARRA